MWQSARCPFRQRRPPATTPLLRTKASHSDFLAGLGYCLYIRRDKEGALEQASAQATTV
jgi:hypothetical protein